MELDISNLSTEARNEKTYNIDMLNVLDAITLINNEDKTVAFAIEKILPKIAEITEMAIKTIKNGGRLIYIGSGTSGRIAVLDASDCPTTFDITDEIMAIMPGGLKSFINGNDADEDNFDAAKKDLTDVNFCAKDMLIGISASGRSPHTVGAITYANEIFANSASISCSYNSEISKISKISLEILAGPEVITGSTRLKAGTAQKMVLNMISTASMIGIGKTFGNLMVDARPSNMKLLERSYKIIMQATDCSYETAISYYNKAKNTKLAIVMILINCDLDTAKLKLENAQGFISKI